MNDVLKFPNKGVIRDEEGAATGFYQGYTEEQVLAKVAEANKAIQALPLADDMARELGYESLWDMQDDDRFALVEKAMTIMAEKEL